MSSTAKELIHVLNQSLGHIMYDKAEVTQQALACLLANGHLLLEDLPGMGKTTLAHGLANIFGLAYQRVQFTSDLLPADILGSSVYQSSTEQFSFRKGPVFTQVLLADEINRASPKTQSALLEAMGERQVTADGQTYPLASPFFVIATQNPLHQSGTFPLPESQLDRFMMRLSLGYPSEAAERMLLTEGHAGSLFNSVEPIVTLEQLHTLQRSVADVTASDHVLDYLQRLLRYTRESAEYPAGLSPRAALSWLHCAKAWALIHQRNYVIPDDLQAVMLPVVGHRLLPKENLSSVKTSVETMMRQVPVVD
jgi:MoxR-like ATPase